MTAEIIEERTHMGHNPRIIAALSELARRKLGKGMFRELDNSPGCGVGNLADIAGMVPINRLDAVEYHRIMRENFGLTGAEVVTIEFVNDGAVYEKRTETVVRYLYDKYHEPGTTETVEELLAKAEAVPA